MVEVAASIVVPSRGGATRLPVLLSALALQDTDDFEVIVVIDGDIDGSARILGDISKRHNARIRSVVLPENRGRSAALNAGAEIAAGRVLIRCDDDLEPGRSYVSGHIEQHRHARTGAVGLYRNVFPETVYARVYGRRADERFRRDAMAADEMSRWRYWAGNVSVLREVHEALGGYDETFRTYGWEDVDYGYRLHKLGVPVKIVPDLTTPHHVAATTTAIRAVRALHSGAARELFLKKHGPDSLGVPTVGTGMWNRLVSAGSLFATERSLRVWGNAIDKASAVTPGLLSEKLVAHTVESAGLAGIRFPARARANF